MLVWLFEMLQEYYSGFNVFRYLTLRSILSMMTALLTSLLLGPYLIRFLGSCQWEQTVRDDGPGSHAEKSGTPTMGGLLIVGSLLLSTLLWARPDNRLVQLAVLVTLLFAIIGFVDDWMKIKRDDSSGLRARTKFFWQSVVGFGAVYMLMQGAVLPAETELLVPFVKSAVFPLGWGFLLLSYLVVVGTSNAVNLTDGLDGLAIMPVVLIAGALGIFAYVTGHAEFSQYLGFPHLPLTGELAVFCGAIAGAGLGFLWFNTYPAQVFMGDIGALSLGAALGLVAVMVRQELTLFIMAGVFVLETVSVVVQVLSYRYMGRRVFRMAPLHHHFELKGWPEPRVIVRFWIISLMLVLIGLSSLKIR